MDIFKLPLFDETIDYLEGSEEQESDEEEGTDDHEDSFVPFDDHLEIVVVLRFVDLDDSVSLLQLVVWEGPRTSRIPV